MARTGKKNQALVTGRIAYGHDGTDAYPQNVDATGQKITLLAGTAEIGKLAANSGGDIGDVDVTTLPQREPFIFRVGRSALASGAVASGTRSGGPTVSSTAADTTEWGTEVVYEPYRAGKIDGLTTDGVISGQLTMGIVTASGSAQCKLTARMRNKAGSAQVVFLALTGAFAATTAEIFKTYDIPHLLTTTDFNAVPFGVTIGVRSAGAAASAGVARIMESSYVQGEFEPGT